MDIVDANVLLSAVNRSDLPHDRSRAWLDTQLSGGGTVGFPWTCVLAFLRLATHPTIFARPLSVSAASTQVEAWLACSTAVPLDPTPTHLPTLVGLLAQAGVGGNLVNDAHLAALSLEHRARIISWDSDFARFPGVRWAHPSP